jgi:SHS2 domain-containing protein
LAVEFLDHTADIGVRISGASPEELVREAARAFYLILLDEGSLGRVEAREEREVDLSGPDGESVLVDFLGELIYRFDAEKLLLPEVQVEEARLEPGGGRLRARLRGERFDPLRHELRTEVKAATYHAIEIRSREGMLSVEVIFDL